MWFEVDECHVQADLVKRGAIGDVGEGGLVNVEGNIKGTALGAGVDEPAFFRVYKVVIGSVGGGDDEAFEDGLKAVSDGVMGAALVGLGVTGSGQEGVAVDVNAAARLAVRGGGKCPERDTELPHEGDVE